MKASPVATAVRLTLRISTLNQEEKILIFSMSTVLNFTGGVGKAIKWFLHLCDFAKSVPWCACCDAV